jgi:hypothetical protein
VKILEKGSNFAILPVFDSVNQTFPAESVVIARGCVQKVGILNSVMYLLDFVEFVPQNVVRLSSGKLSAGVPVSVVDVVGLVLGLLTLRPATLTTEIIKTAIKAKAKSFFEFFFTKGRQVFLVISYSTKA